MTAGTLKVPFFAQLSVILLYKLETGGSSASINPSDLSKR